MALRKNTVSIPLVKGVETKRSDKVSEPGSLSDCSNIIINKIGELEKREGNKVVISPGANSTPYDSEYPLAGETIIQTGKSVAMLDGQKLYGEAQETTKYKQVGELLPIHLESDVIQESNQAKCGPVQYQSVTSTAGQFDVYLWTQTVPFESSTTTDVDSLFESYVLIKAKSEDTVIFGPKRVVLERRRSVAFPGWADNHAYASHGPHTQMLFIASTDRLYFFHHDTGTGNIVVQYIDLSSASPSFAVASAGNIVTDIFDSCASFTVASHNNAATFYLAYYKSYTASGVTRPSDLILKKFTETGAGTFSTDATDNVTNGFYGTTQDSQRSDMFDFLGAKDNIALRVFASSGTFAQTFPVFIAYSSFNWTAGQHTVFVDCYAADLGSSATGSGGTTPNGVDFLLDSNHCVLRAATAAPKDANNYYVALEVLGVPGSSIAKTIKTVSVTAAGTGYTDGFCELESNTLSASPFKRNAVGYLETNASGHCVSVNILDPGSGFDPSVTVNVVQGSASGGQASVTINTVSPKPLRPQHGIISFELNTSSPPGPTQNITDYDFRNASLVSDMFLMAPVKQATSSSGAVPYFMMSKTIGVGSSRSLSGNMYLASSRRAALTDTSESAIVAAHIIGQHSLDFTADFYSRLRNKFSLLDGVSRVSSSGGNTKFGLCQFRSNIDVFPNVSPGGTFFGSEVSEDQQYVGTAMQVTLRTDRPYPNVSTGRKSYIGGGSLFCYDGDQLFENNFFEAPSVRNIIEVSAPASTLTGTFTYAFTYSAIDASNDFHESPVHIDSTARTVSNGQVVGEIYITDATRRSLDGARKPVLNIYRTQNAGQIFFKLQSIELNPNSESIVFVDKGGNELDIEAPLYISSGESENLTTGSITDLVLYKNKLIACGPRNICFVSKPGQDGFSFGFPVIAPFQIRTPDPDDKITMVEQNMDSLMISTVKDVFGVFGEGPSAIGQGPFTEPKLVGKSKGAILNSPHVNTSSGVYYISSRGVYRVAPNYKFDYVGAPVEDLLSTYTARSILTKESQNEIQFLVNKSNSSRILVYNVLFQQWYSWDLAIGNASHPGTNAIDQVCDMLFSGESNQVFLLQSNGAIVTDVAKVAGSNKDEFYVSSASSSVNEEYDMSFKLHSIAAAGLQASQRVYRVMLLGEFASSHTLTLDVFNGYDSSYTERHQQTISSDTNPYQFRAHLKNQKNRAIALECTLATSNGGGAAKVSGVAFEVGARPDTFKLPKTQTLPEV